MSFSYIKAAKEYGSQIAACTALGIPRSTFSTRLKIEKLQAEAFAAKTQQPVEAIKIDQASVKMDVKPRIRIKAGSSLLDGLKPAQPDGDNGPISRPMFGYFSSREPNVLLPVSENIVRVLFVGDVHGHPNIEEESARCLKLATAHAAVMKPDAFVLGGDFMDWASVCHHEKNATWRGRRKVTIAEDMATFRELLTVLSSGLNRAGVMNRVFTWGNHEDWLNQFENEHPEVHGQYTGEVQGLFKKNGFKSFPYGEYATIAGVDFTHVPKNKMDRPVGGQTPENTVAQQATRDTVFCHTHVHAMGKRTKFGFRNAVTVLNGGSCMPLDYVGDYAQRTTGSYVDTGIMEVDIADGRIIGHSWISMQRLEALYGEEVS